MSHRPHRPKIANVDFRTNRGQLVCIHGYSDPPDTRNMSNGNQPMGLGRGCMSSYESYESIAFGRVPSACLTAAPPPSERICVNSARSHAPLPASHVAGARSPHSWGSGPADVTRVLWCACNVARRVLEFLKSVLTFHAQSDTRRARFSRSGAASAAGSHHSVHSDAVRPWRRA